MKQHRLLYNLILLISVTAGSYLSGSNNDPQQPLQGVTGVAGFTGKVSKPDIRIADEFDGMECVSETDRKGVKRVTCRYERSYHDWPLYLLSGFCGAIIVTWLCILQHQPI